MGPLCGGVVAGAVFRGYVKMLKGQVTSDSNPWATTALGTSSVTADLTPQKAANDTSLAAAGSAVSGAADVGLHLVNATVPKLFL